MKRRLVPVLTALATLTAVAALAFPANAAATVIQVLGRKAVTYTSYPFDPTPTSKWASSSQGEFVDTNGNGIADSLRGRGADLEDYGIIRFREDYVRLQVLRGSTWETRLANETDVVTAQARAYGIIYTPPGLVCRTDPSLTDTYRVQHSVLFRRSDNVVGRRTLNSNTFTARLLATDPACPESPPPPPPPSADVAVAKTASVATVPGGAGTAFAYTITVRNLDTTDAAASVVVTDTLPADVDLAGPLPANCVDTDAGAPVVLRCTFGTLDPGEVNSVTINVTADVSDFSDDLIRNTARVASTTADPNLANNTATADVLVRPLADLVMDKAADQSTVFVPGDTFRYVLRVTNTGPSTAADVIVYDNLPAGVDLAGPLPAGCALDATTPSLDDFVCDYGTVVAGATESFSIGVVTTDERADDTLPITNIASVRTSTYEQDTADNSDSVTVTVVPSPTAS